MRSNRSHLGSRHVALEPGRVRYSVVKGKAAGRSTMPGLHGCKELCVGCQLHRCSCRPSCRPDNPGSGCLHLCNLCATLYVDWEMTLEEVRFEVVRILRAHAAELEQAAHPCPSPCPRSGSEEAPGISHGQRHTYLVITIVFAVGVIRLVW